MFRASTLLLIAGLSLAACDVHVREPGPIVVEKKTVIEQKPAPVEIHVNDK